MVLPQLTTRIRLACGLGGIVAGVLVAASLLGVIPDQRTMIRDGRQRLANSLSASCSALIAGGNPRAAAAIIHEVVRSDPQLESAGLRHQGQLVLDTGGHRDRWDAGRLGAAGDGALEVEIRGREGAWGMLELRFQPLRTAGWSAWLARPWLRVPAVVAPLCALLFMVHLTRVLRRLDPAAAIPPRVRDALDVMAEGLLLVDDQMIIRFANQALGRMLDLPPAKLVGRDVNTLAWRLAEDADDESPQLPWQQAIERETSVHGVTLGLVDSEGSLRSLNVGVSPILAESQVRGVMICLDDVTHLEAVQRELKAARDEATAASKAKSDFLANVSHEIRTPLNAVLGFTDVLRRGLVESAEERQGHLETIFRSGNHLLELINDILDLSKIESGRMHVESLPTAVHEVVQDVARVLSVRAEEKGLALDVEFLTAIPQQVRLDPTRLRQIVTNLVGNAIKFTETGSVKIQVGMADHDASLTIRVIDTGIGMNAEQQSKVFDAFVQADSSTTRKFGGTGLGLSISRYFAEAMGGELTVSSTPNIGTTFSLHLPCGSLLSVHWISPEETNAPIATEVAAPQIAHLQPADVLIVDDGEANRQLIELVLKRAGCRPTTACNGAEALRALAAGDFSLVFMDMQMPVMDGWTAVAEIRRRNNPVPIVALTGNAMKGDRERCLAVGCNAFLTKPVSIDALLACAASVVGTRDPAEIEASAALESASHPAAPAAAAAPVAAAPAIKGSPIRSTLPMDDPEFRSAVRTYVDSLGTKLDEMITATEREDFEALARLAHWLKGSGGTMGLHAFTEPAKDLEQAAQKRQAERATLHLREVVQLARRVEIPHD